MVKSCVPGVKSVGGNPARRWADTPGKTVCTPVTTFFSTDGNQAKLRGAAMGCESGVVDVRTDVGEAERGGTNLRGPPSAGASAGGEPSGIGSSKHWHARG